VELTWRDAVSTLAMAVMLIIYAVFLAGGFWLISSAWATAALLLIVGLAGRVISAGGKAPPAGLLHRMLKFASASFGVIALLAGLIALFLSSSYALRIFIMSSIVAWLTDVVSHI
jgi:hypothetical protein